MRAGAFTGTPTPVSVCRPAWRGVTENKPVMKAHEMNTNTQVVTVDFHGQQMIAIKNGDEIHVAMKPITESIGIDWKAQYNRIKRHPVMATCVVNMTIQMLGDDQQREVATLPLKMLNGWLFGIDASRVKPECRDKLIEYQRECFDVLASYFMQGEAINPRMQYSVGPNDTLTKEQADTLRSMLTEAAKQRHPDDTKKQGAFIMRGWSKLKAHFKTDYRHIPAIEFTEAVSIASRHVIEGEYMPAANDPQTLNDTIARMTQQVESGNGTPVDVFLPLVMAVVKKQPELLSEFVTEEQLTRAAIKQLQTTRFTVQFGASDYFGSEASPIMVPIAKGAQTFKPQDVINEIASNRTGFFKDGHVKEIICAIGTRLKTAA